MLDCYRPPQYSKFPEQCSRHSFGLLNLPMTKYGEYCFKEVAKIVIVAVVVKSCCCIWVLLAMVTIQRSLLAVINAVAMVNDC